MSLFDNPVVTGIVGSIAGAIGIGIVGAFNGWWRDKTSLPIKVIKEQGKLAASNAKLWEKVIMLRKVLENDGKKIPDREWGYEEVEKDE